MSVASITRTLLGILLGFPRLLYSVLVGSWRQQRSLVRLEREASALGFSQRAFTIAERRARMLGRFGEIDLDVEMKTGKHAGLELSARLNVEADRLKEAGTWVDEALEQYRREHLGLFGSATLFGTEVVIHYQGFSELYPVVEPETVRRLSSGLVDLVDRITRQVGAAQPTADWQRERFFDAIQEADLLAVQLAVSAGLGPARDAEDGRGALHHLEVDDEEDRGVVRMAEVLLDAGADPNAVDHDGVTPLMRAAESGHLRLVTLLLERGADVTPRDATGQTALTFAEDHRKVQKALRDAGAT